MKSVFFLILILLLFTSCDEEENGRCISMIKAPVAIDYERLGPNCLFPFEEYMSGAGFNEYYRITSDVELLELTDHEYCDNIPQIDFVTKDLIGKIISFTGGFETKSTSEAVFRNESGLVEVVICDDIKIAKGKDGEVSQVESYRSFWFEVDKLDETDSVIFTFK